MTSDDIVQQIHAVLSVPFHFTSETAGDIATILEVAGYSFPTEDEAADIQAQYGYNAPTAAFAKWRP